MKNKKKNKYILSIVLVIVMITGIFVGIYLYQRHVENMENIANMEREAELEMLRRDEILDEISYAYHMFFGHNFPAYGNPNNSRDPFNTTYVHIGLHSGQLEISEVVFVHSAEEAEGFAEDVFVAWPTEWSELYLEFINGWLDPEVRGHVQHVDMVIDIDDLNIELPLTRELMVEDWELMIEIRERLGYDRPGRSNDSKLRSFVERRIREAMREREEAENEEEATAD